MDSGILFSAVATSSTILVSNERTLGDFENVTNSFLPSVSVERNTKSCFSSENLQYHILVEDMLIYVCAADVNFGKNIPYAFLNEVKSKFTSGSLVVRALTAGEHEFDRDFGHVLNDLMVKYSKEGHTMDGMAKVSNQVKDVTAIMNENIQKVFDRGDKLETLVERTNDLEVSSSQFRSTSKKIRRKMWCKNTRMWIIVFVLVSVIITVIALMSTNVIPVNK